jgi:hypothetical protein
VTCIFIKIIPWYLIPLLKKFSIWGILGKKNLVSVLLSFIILKQMDYLL